MKIIAEVGSNWKTLNDCIYSIKQARRAGAHAVKFQLFNHQELYGQNINFEKIGETPYLHPDWISILKKECDENEIEFMCTAFSVHGYEKVNPFVSSHKIASAEMTDINILNTVNSFGKTVYLSTGGSNTSNDIRHALLYLKNCPVTIMYCVADYPAKIIDFRKLDQMKYYFGDNYSYGYSDHSIDVFNIPMTAKSKGCSVIEKHVNFTNHKDTNDSGHSLNFEEFSLMSRALMGEMPTIEETESLTNKDMRKIYRRRFIVTKEINSGDKFQIGKNVGIFRATRAYENPVMTFRPWDIEGKVSNKNKIIGEVVCYPDLDQ